ncbi:MAG: hypothetical protein FWE87_06250 [Coriobacteriia bacterium]|nr:hypothetical protein [Coriobacteriia bacterium]
MKRACLYLTLFIVAFTISGCDVLLNRADTAYIGKWEAIEVAISASTYLASESYLEIREGGDAFFVLNNTETNAAWTLEGNDLKLTVFATERGFDEDLEFEGIYYPDEMVIYSLYNDRIDIIFAPQGGTETIVGRWDAIAVQSYMGDLDLKEHSIELLGQGKAILTADGIAYDATWSKDGSNIQVTATDDYYFDKDDPVIDGVFLDENMLVLQDPFETFFRITYRKIRSTD